MCVGCARVHCAQHLLSFFVCPAMWYYSNKCCSGDDDNKSNIGYAALIHTDASPLETDVFSYNKLRKKMCALYYHEINIKSTNKCI